MYNYYIITKTGLLYRVLRQEFKGEHRVQFNDCTSLNDSWIESGEYFREANLLLANEGEFIKLT